MTDLWKPSKADSNSISRGNRKLKMLFLKQQKIIESVDCPACKKSVYYSPTEDRFYTLGGSSHECKGLKQADKSAEFEIGASIL